MKKSSGDDWEKKMSRISLYTRKLRRRNKPVGASLCDKLWSKIIRFSKVTCEMCGKPKKTLNAHHLISRRARKYRWNTKNGICICPGCHKFSLTAVHVSPWIFEKWLELNKLEQYKWWIENRNNLEETSDKIDYNLLFLTLLKEYRNISGEPILFDEDEQQIVKLYQEGTWSCYDLAKKFRVGGHAISAILRRHKIRITDKVTMTKRKTGGVPRSIETKEKIKRTIKENGSQSGEKNGMYGVRRCGKENPNYRDGNHCSIPSYQDSTGDG